MCGVIPLMVASTIIGGAGQVMSANAQASAANYSAAVTAQNAVLAERRARDALDRGAEEEREVRLRGGMLASEQTAQMAAAGLDLGFGSPMDVLVGTLTGIELDSARVRRNAAAEADDFDRQAWSYRVQGGLDRAQAGNARRAGAFGVVSTVLTGASEAYRYKASLQA